MPDSCYNWLLDMNPLPKIRISLISVSDRASRGVYEDRGIPALKEWLGSAILNPIEFIEAIIPDEQKLIEEQLRKACDQDQCHLVFTTGGTGPALRDVTPEATLAVATKILPGFGEQMRAISLHFVPTAILSRQVAVLRGCTLIINLPGQPKSIRQILAGLPGKAEGIFAAIPYCVDLILGPFIETNPDVCRAFRPASAQKN